MCFSYNVIEQQAYEMCEKIREHSLYKFVGVVSLEGNHSRVLKPNDYKEAINGVALITKVILEDKVGTHYSVEPNLDGLRFARGEITYKDYRKLRRKESLFGFTISFGFIVFFSVMLFVLLKYFM